MHISVRQTSTILSMINTTVNKPTTTNKGFLSFLGLENISDGKAKNGTHMVKAGQRRGHHGTYQMGMTLADGRRALSHGALVLGAWWRLGGWDLCERRMTLV